MTTNVQEVAVPESLLEAEEVARQLAVPKTWVYMAAREGKFPCVRNGRHVRFRQRDVDEWIANGGKGLDE